MGEIFILLAKASIAVSLGLESNFDLSKARENYPILNENRAVIKSAKDNNLNSYLLDYRTSFDYSKDNQSVVGYMSAILYDK